MARISIYVPDDRKPEIDAAKKRLNLSQIFIEAFDREIKRANATPTMEDGEMNEMIARLRKQGTHDRERGWKDGAKDALRLAKKKLRVGDFEAIAEGTIVFSRKRRSNTWLNETFFDASPDDRYAADQADYQWLSHLAKDCGVDIPVYLDGYDEGFTEQITTIWDQIRSDVLEDRTTDEHES